MSGNSFGKAFVITTCGESHGVAMAAIIDGCPSGMKLSESDIQLQLDRRKPGQNVLTSARQEKDKVSIMSGVFDGMTLGTPIMLLVNNIDARKQDYEHLKNIFRPSHADYTYFKKYGIRDYYGGGRASARETVARVAAGAIARKFMLQYGVQVMSYVQQVGSISTDISYHDINDTMIENSIVRCPDFDTTEKMVELISDCQASGDSVGGIICCVIRNVPIGLGEPVFNKLNSHLAQAMCSINAVKGFEIGSGFHGATLFGSQNNDHLYVKNGKVVTKSNNAGGIVGGISNGEDICMRIAFKPVATINKEQSTCDINNNEIVLTASGRHDSCVLPRAVPIVDAMAWLVIMDHFLLSKHQCQPLH